MTTIEVTHEEIQLRRQRARTATLWRIGHRTDRDRERLWRAFRTGALAGIAQRPPAEQAMIRAALKDAEQAVPFTTGRTPAPLIGESGRAR